MKKQRVFVIVCTIVLLCSFVIAGHLTEKSTGGEISSPDVPVSTEISASNKGNTSQEEENISETKEMTEAVTRTKEATERSTEAADKSTETETKTTKATEKSTEAADKSTEATKDTTKETAEAATQKAETTKKDTESFVKPTAPSVIPDTEHPALYIYSDSAVNSKDYYVNCVISTQNVPEEQMLVQVPAEIRVRGNSTALGTSTPPFKIKFKEKNNLLGLHDGKTFKTWVLLNQVEGLCSYYMSLKMAQIVYGDQYYVSDALLVKVYLNDRYMGIYTACEQNQIKKNRIDVKKAETGDEPGNSIGYFFELDNYAEESGHPYFEIDSDELLIRDFQGRQSYYYNKFYTVKNDVLSGAQLDFISKYMNNLYRLIHAATYDGIAYEFDANYDLQLSALTPEQAIRNVIDVDSAVAIYLMEELTNNEDKGSGSFFFAIDFSEGAKYQKLTFTPPWDMSWCNYSTLNDYYAATINDHKEEDESDNTWLVMLMYNEWFRQEVSNRVQQIKATGALEAFLHEASGYVYSYESEVSPSYFNDAVTRINLYNYRYQWMISAF